MNSVAVLLIMDLDEKIFEFLGVMFPNTVEEAVEEAIEEEKKLPARV